MFCSDLCMYVWWCVYPNVDYVCRLVAYILSDEGRRAEWEAQCAVMASRLNDVRKRLFHALTYTHRVKGTWVHVLAQKGV